MRIELERYLDCVYRMADSIGKGSSSSTRSVFDALKAQALSDLTRKRSAHCNPPPKGKRGARGDSLVKDQVNQRASLLHSDQEWKNFLVSVSR